MFEVQFGCRIFVAVVPRRGAELKAEKPKT